LDLADATVALHNSKGLLPTEWLLQGFLALCPGGNHLNASSLSGN